MNLYSAKLCGRGTAVILIYPASTRTVVVSNGRHLTIFTASLALPTQAPPLIIIYMIVQVGYSTAEHIPTVKLMKCSLTHAHTHAHTHTHTHTHTHLKVAVLPQLFWWTRSTMHSTPSSLFCTQLYLHVYTTCTIHGWALI